MLRFRLLGPMQVNGVGGWVDVNGALRRVVLATLLLNAGKVMSSAQLCARLWPNSGPDQIANALQAHISRLRSDLDSWFGNGEGHRRISSGELGYCLHIDSDELDVEVFDALHKHANDIAHEDPEKAACELRRALDLWKGEVLHGVREDNASLYGSSVQLEEQRVLVTERLITLDLELGRHQTVIGDLEILTLKHPLHERFYEQLMVALAGVGRTADAMAVYQRVRQRMVHDLGIGPSTALQRRFQKILDNSADE